MTTTSSTELVHGLYTEGEPIQDTKAPSGSHRAALEHAQVRRLARQPGQPPQAVGHHRRHRPRRRRGGRDARRGGLRGEDLLLPGLAATRPLDRRAGRHQRGQELQGGRGLDVPSLLRHRQGRRLPLARVERLPPRRGQHEHHRPVRRAGRPVRPRVRRPARQPLLRRCAGLAHVLRPRPDRPAAAHRRLPGARAPGRGRHGRDVQSARDARGHRRRRQGARHHRPRPRHGRDRDPPRRRGRARERRLRQRLLPLDQRDGLQRHRDVARAPQGRATSPTPATRRSTRPASRSPASTRAS